MQTLAQALTAAGKAPKVVVYGPAKPPAHLLKANALWHKRKRTHRPAKHFADVKQVMRASMRNPSVSGTMPSHARMVDGAGSDAHRAYKLSGPSVRFGWKGARDGQSHADEKRDYWLNE